MKTTLTIKTLIYLTTLMLGVFLTRAASYAAYVEPLNDSTVVVSLSTADQSFDEALMMGLRLLDQSDRMTKYGIIKIFYQDCCVSARVKLADFSRASMMDSAEFVRTYVKFQ